MIKLAFIFLIFATPVLALPVDVPLASPALEARARGLFHELRCPVCQNQSIDDSDADLAYDLRQHVRTRLLAGDSDAAIRVFLQARYGDFILFRPPVAPYTYILWSAPLLLLMLGLYIGFRKKARQ